MIHLVKKEFGVRKKKLFCGFFFFGFVSNSEKDLFWKKKGLSLP